MMTIMKRNCVSLMCIAVLLCSMTVAHAKERLTTKDIDRIKAYKHLVADVDTNSVGKTVTMLERSDNPRLNLTLKEAIARTYAEIVLEQGISDSKKKIWLYSMVGLNMAYFQFAGSNAAQKNVSDLNRMIRGKLRKHLPEDIFEQPGFNAPID